MHAQKSLTYCANNNIRERSSTTWIRPLTVELTTLNVHQRASINVKLSPKAKRRLSQLLSDFINLTQVHNFTVSAQDIFTFRRLSVFTVSFTRTLQVLMQIMKRFVPSYRLVKWLWYRVYNQKVVSSSPGVFFFLTFIRFVWFHLL